MNKQIAREALRAAVEALTPLGICWWVDCGTLLGLVREGDFLEHDLDVDLATTDWQRSEEIAEALRAAGFTSRPPLGTPEHGYEQRFLFKGLKVDLFYFYTEGETCWQGSWLDKHLIVSRFPSGYIESTEPFDFQGLEVPVPTQAEQLLEARYGDWRTVREDWDWSKDPKCITPETHPDNQMDQVTFLIKTFLRPDSVRRAVESIRRFHPESDILVVDDGGSDLEGLDAKVVRLPYDSGLSAGRNAGVRRVKTKYVALFDDDMHLTKETNIPAMLGLLREADIVCGSMRQGTKIVHWEGRYETPPNGLVLVPIKEKYEELGGTRFARVEFGLNAFVARTAFLKKHPWDEKLKLHEHTDFFLRLKGEGRVLFAPDSIFQHDRVTNPQYDFMRRRTEFRLRFFAKHGLKYHVGLNGYRDNWTLSDVQALDSLQGRRPPIPVSKLKRYQTNVNGVETVLRLNDADAKRLGLYEEPKTETKKPKTTTARNKARSTKK